MILLQLNSGYATERVNPSWFDASGAQAVEDAAPPLAAGIDDALLPFTVRIVSTEAELAAVQALRATAYGRHLPHLKAAFGQADPLDRQPGTAIFCAEDKLTGELVGSARIQTNRRAPLQIERSVALPDAYRGRLLAEITRLTVRPGYTGPVRLALVKASHLYCIAMQIGAVLAGSRQALLRSYRMLGFSPVFEDGRQVPLVHAGGLPHHVLVRDMVTAEADTRARNAADHAFVFRTFHPDIDLFAAVGDRVGLGLQGGLVH